MNHLPRETTQDIIGDLKYKDLQAFCSTDRQNLKTCDYVIRKRLRMGGVKPSEIQRMNDAAIVIFDWEGSRLPESINKGRMPRLCVIEWDPTFLEQINQMIAHGVGEFEGSDGTSKQFLQNTDQLINTDTVLQKYKFGIRTIDHNKRWLNDEWFVKCAVLPYVLVDQNAHLKPITLTISMKDVRIARRVVEPRVSDYASQSLLSAYRMVTTIIICLENIRSAPYRQQITDAPFAISIDFDILRDGFHKLVTSLLNALWNLPKKYDDQWVTGDILIPRFAYKETYLNPCNTCIHFEAHLQGSDVSLIVDERMWIKLTQRPDAWTQKYSAIWTGIDRNRHNYISMLQSPKTPAFRRRNNP